MGICAYECPRGYTDGGNEHVKKFMMGTEAAALAANCQGSVVSAYPITPQTVIVENLADMIGRAN